MASRPNLAQRRSTSSVVQLAKKDAEGADAEPSTSAPKRSTKQFVAHSRHHRVPSGRNLKKLTGTRSHGDLVALAQAAAVQQAQAHAAEVNQGSKAHSTSPVPPWERVKEKEREAKAGGHALKKRSRSNPKRSLSTPNANSKKATFELASAPGSFDDTADQLAQADIDDAMNVDAAKNAYMGQARPPITPIQSDIPDVSRTSQLEEETNGDGPLSRAEHKREGSTADHRRSASTSHIKFAPAPTRPVSATTSNVTKLANGNRIDSVSDHDTSDTPKMNTPQTPQPVLTPRSDLHPQNRARSPPFHATNNPTAIPPQVSTMNAIAHADVRRSMSSVSSGTGPQPVTSRFITSSSSPSGALSSPSSVRETPVKQRNSMSFDTPPTPHATPPSESAPISALNQDSFLRKSGTSNISGTKTPNRTQTKILLQKQISQAELEQERRQQQMQMQQGQMFYHNTHSRRGSTNTDPGTEAVKLPREAMREVERINREYANVRRFISPVGDSVVRLKGYMKSNRIPQQRRSLERDGSGPQSLGLSQSLGANVGNRGGDGTRQMVSVSGGGSKDDFGLAGRTGGMDEAKIRELLIHVWNRDEPGNNNLSSSN